MKEKISKLLVILELENKEAVCLSDMSGTAQNVILALMPLGLIETQDRMTLVWKPVPKSNPWDHLGLAHSYRLAPKIAPMKKRYKSWSDNKRNRTSNNDSPYK